MRSCRLFGWSRVEKLVVCRCLPNPNTIGSKFLTDLTVKYVSSAYLFRSFCGYKARRSDDVLRTYAIGPINDPCTKLAFRYCIVVLFAVVSWIKIFYYRAVASCEYCSESEASCAILFINYNKKKQDCLSRVVMVTDGKQQILNVIFYSISNESCKPLHLNCDIKHNSNVMVCSIDLK